MPKSSNKKLHRSTLTLCLNRVSEGDDNFRHKLCRKLADRLLFLPTIPSKSGETQDGITVKAKRIELEDKIVVPVFTEENFYQAWQETLDERLKPISLLGADVCMVIGQRVWLLVDPETENEVLLDPEAVAEIVMIGNESLEDEFMAVELPKESKDDTDIIELDTPLDELQYLIKEFNADMDRDNQASEPAEKITSEEKEKPTGLKAWLGL